VNRWQRRADSSRLALQQVEALHQDAEVQVLQQVSGPFAGARFRGQCGAPKSTAAAWYPWLWRGEGEGLFAEGGTEVRAAEAGVSRRRVWSPWLGGLWGTGESS